MCQLVETYHVYMAIAIAKRTAATSYLSFWLMRCVCLCIREAVYLSIFSANSNLVSMAALLLRKKKKKALHAIATLQYTTVLLLKVTNMCLL